MKVLNTKKVERTYHYMIRGKIYNNLFCSSCLFFLTRNEKLVAVACLNMGAKASEVAFWIENGNTPSIAELKYV